MSTIHGSSISVTRKSEPGTRRRQSRALASAVGDLVGHSGSVTTTVDGSYNSTTQGYGGGLGPALMHRPPYMDVQTVKTNLTVDQAAKLEGQSHCLLLVEPVLLPNLGHTGVAREILPGDRPLFYPNGKKNCSLGATVRNAVYQSTTIHPAGATAAGRQQQHGGTSSNSQQLYHNHTYSSGHEHRQQGPPSDWAGSSAYYTLASENSSSGYNSIPHQHGSKKHSDEGSASAAIPAGQGGRFSTDVWGTPPGEDEGHLYNTTDNGRRRRRTNAGGGGGAGAAAMARRPNSGSVDSGSVVDRRLARYPGREGGGRCSSEESLLAGRKAEFIRTQQQQQQLQSNSNNNNNSSSNNSITTIEHLPAKEGETPTTTADHHAQNKSTPTSSTHNSYEDFVAAPARNGGASSTTTSDWTTSGPTTIGGGDIVRAAGRDSEWLAERRAADREAKEVLRALKNTSARLCFLVGGG